MARRIPTKKKQAPVRRSSTSDQVTSLMMDTPEGIWRSSRALAATVFGSFAPAIYALMPRFTDIRTGFKQKLWTMAVDRYYRCYVNNGFTMWMVKKASEVSRENPCVTCGATKHHNLAYVAGVICHEAQHPARDHSGRAERINVEKHKLWNVAADLEINDDLLEIFGVAYTQGMQDGLAHPKLCLPKGVLLPVKFREKYGHYGIDFPDDQMAETYYWNVLDLREKVLKDLPEKEADDLFNPPKPNLDDMSDEELEKFFDQEGGSLFDVDCGSGAHGDEADYEDGDPGPDNPGISESEGEVIQREIARNLAEQQATRGNVPAGMRRWAEEVLAPPKYDWKKEFTKAVRRAVHRAWGHDQRSWRVLGRMSGGTMYRALMPSRYTPTPKIGIVLDTSGSMGGGAAGTALHTAVSEVEGICKATSANVTFLSVDVKTSEVAEISNFKDALNKDAMQGGGGTDMRVGIKVMAEMREPPDVCIVLTDGETAWPVGSPRKDMIVIAGLVGRYAKGTVKDVPKWMRYVVIDEEE